MMLLELIRTYRKLNKLTLRDLQKQTGVSYVTLHRFEHGHTINHTEMVKLLQWMMEPKKGK